MTKMLSASGGRGLCPQTPVIGSCSTLAMVPPQPLTPSAAYAGTGSPGVVPVVMSVLLSTYLVCLGLFQFFRLRLSVGDSRD